MIDLETEMTSYRDGGLNLELLGLIKTGKEATVHLVRAEDRLFALKVFKDQVSRTFQNRADYSMTILKPTSRLARAVKNKSRLGKKLEEGLWMSREVSTLKRLRAAGADVPSVVAVGANSFVMEYIGTEAGAAPRLAEVRSAIPNARSIFEQIFINLKILQRCGIVHGDLSPYNILVPSADKVVLIDFPQAVQFKLSDTAVELLERDVRNICAWFRRLGFECDENELLDWLFD